MLLCTCIHYVYIKRIVRKDYLDDTKYGLYISKKKKKWFGKHFLLLLIFVCLNYIFLFNPCCSVILFHLLILVLNRTVLYSIVSFFVHDYRVGNFDITYNCSKIHIVYLITNTNNKNVWPLLLRQLPITRPNEIDIYNYRSPHGPYLNISYQVHNKHN